MRVVVTVHQFLPDHSAGTEVIALGIARELQRRGHAVTVVTGHPDDAPRPDADRFDRLRYDGLDVERFRYSAHPMGGQRTITGLSYDNRLFAEAFDALLARLRPDVVHFVHLARLSASIVAPCVARGIPTVFTATDFWAVCPYSQLRLPDGSVCEGPDAQGLNCVRHMAASFTGRSGTIGRVIRQAPDWMLAAGVHLAHRSLPLMPTLAAEVQALVQRPAFVRAQLNQVDRVLAPSRAMAATLVAGGIAPELVQVLPYGIAVERFARDVDRGTRPTLRLGFVGTLVEHKGLHVLLDAMRRVDAALPVELHVFGPAGSSPACRAYLAAAEAQARQDPRIRFGGPVGHDGIPDVLATIDALVVPSVWRENTPLVVYEAFAAGCPVLASDMDGIAEVVRHEVDGLLFPVGDGAALAACICRVAEDRALLRRLAAHTRVPASVSAHVDALESIYREIMRAPMDETTGERAAPRTRTTRALTSGSHLPPRAAATRFPGHSVRRPPAPAAPASPSVQVLLSTYNGAAYLAPLLESLDGQRHHDLELLVRDDGSQDDTLAVLREHGGRVPRTVQAGAHVGLPETFFELLRASRPDADLFAFCDQDDVWLPDKLTRAVQRLGDVDPARPALYCGRAWYVDRALRTIGLAELPVGAPSFGHALLRNIAPGCTMVMNRAARDLLVEHAPDGVFMHDAWAYLVVSAFGTVVYDRIPTLLYRQHGGNAVGLQRSPIARLTRLARHGWTWPHLRQARHFDALYGARLRQPERQALDRLLTGSTTLRDRLRYALTARVYRERLTEDLAFRLMFVAAARP